MNQYVSRVLPSLSHDKDEDSNTIASYENAFQEPLSVVHDIVSSPVCCIAC